MLTLYSNYFYGNEISDYGKAHGYLDYHTLAKAFDAVLNNEIMQKTFDIMQKTFDIDIGYWDLVSGFDYDEEAEEYNEIYQYYIVSEQGARILEECNEIVYYNEELDLYIWGVTHYGTSWDYVLTNVKIENGDN